MKVTLNGDVKELVNESLTIAELLKIEAVKDPEMVSVQLNGEFVNREDFSKKEVKDCDEIDFLYFMGGGQ